MNRTDEPEFPIELCVGAVVKITFCRSEESGKNSSGMNHLVHPEAMIVGMTAEGKIRYTFGADGIKTFSEKDAICLWASKSGNGGGYVFYETTSFTVIKDNELTSLLENPNQPQWLQDAVSNKKQGRELMLRILRKRNNLGPADSSYVHVGDVVSVSTINDDDEDIDMEMMSGSWG